MTAILFRISIVWDVFVMIEILVCFLPVENTDTFIITEKIYMFLL